MPIPSPFPPVPALPEINTHTFCFNRPDQAEWPEDYTLYIDARTGRKRKYKEFIERIRLGATGMNEPLSEGGLGIEPGKGELIGVLGQNSYNYITLIHSCLYLTIPFALISAYSTPFELNHAFNLAKPTRLFVDAKYLPAALPVAKKAGIPLSKIHVLDGAVKGRQSLSEVIKTVRVRKVPVIPVQPAKKDTLAYLVFSSGTSGLPKAVMISHGNIIYSMAQALINGLVTSQVHAPPPYNTPEGLPIVLAVLPLHHTYGLHYFTLRCFLAPSTYVLIGQWDLEVALKSIPKYQITAAPLIPSLIHQIVNYPQIHKIDLSSLTSAGSGAAYLPPDLAEKFKKLMPGEARLSEGYGMSEGTISAIIQPFPGVLGGKQPITGSTGVLMPGMEAKLIRDDGSEAGVDEVGELWLAGGNIALGYWGNEKATKETFVDGWLRTGDAFRVTEGGDFFFADRTKDTLKISGSQVSPVEIENCFLAHPKRLIIDATVAGVSGHGRTSDEKVPRAWVVLSEEGRKLGAVAVTKELDEWHKENLSKYKWCRGGIEVVKLIPKSPTGKVLRRVLQEKYEQQLAKRNKAKL